MLHPPKRHVVLKVFTQNMLIYFSKRAPRAGTARNKWLKEALAKTVSPCFAKWPKILRKSLRRTL